jgi:DNA-binding GntR family transcriptional regulator
MEQWSPPSDPPREVIMQLPETSSVVEHAIETIREKIRRGEFVPGQRLIVADLTQLLNVSPGPVREAIRRLAGEGLVEVQPNRGANVRLLTAREVADIFDLREVVEGLLARQAAKHIREADNYSKLEDIMKRMATSCEMGDVASYSELNQEFHNTIYRISENKRAAEISQQLAMPLYQFRFHHFMDVAMMNHSYRDHEQISKAILEGDSVNAERFMRMHVRNSGMMILETVPTFARPLSQRIGKSKK